MAGTGRRRISLSSQTLIGLVLGIAAGLFFGELVSFLDVAGEAFILLLQMTVLPYVVVSLIGGLGRLSFQEARALALRGGAVLLGLWGFALVMVVLAPFAFPDWETASFFSTTLVEERPPFDFLGTYIPSNPFHSLSETIVPAIVVFSVAMGVALIGIEQKGTLLEVLETTQQAFTRITEFVARLAPLGVFALAASAAGTMDFGMLSRVQVYVLTHAAIALLLVLWLLPGLLLTLTPLRYRELMTTGRDALITAFATGSVLIVLPMLAQNSKDLLRRIEMEGEDVDASVDVLVPTSFNFPGMGKLLSLAFVPFATWFLGQDMAASQYPGFLFTGLVTFFGAVVVALPFLLDYMELPADLFQLYITLDVFASRLGSLLGGMHVLVFSTLATCAIYGRLRFRAQALLRFALVSLLLTASTIGGLRLFFDFALENSYTKDEMLAGMHLLTEPYPHKVYREPPPAQSPEQRAAPSKQRNLWDRILGGLGKEEEPGPGATTSDASAGLDRVRQQNTIRVGYAPDYIPFSYFNAAGDLVGFDVEMAHLLASELDARLEFVPIDSTKMVAQLHSGYCDLVMSGVLVTPLRAREIAFSDPYLEVTFAFVTLDHRREEFSESSEIRERPDLRVGIMGRLPYYEKKLSKLYPNLELVHLESRYEYLEGGRPDLDAMVTAAETGSALTLLHPEFSVVIPRPEPLRIPVAYAARSEDRGMLPFLNAWLNLKEADGTIQALYDHWVLGKGAEERGPRWSVARDVLGWVGDSAPSSDPVAEGATSEATPAAPATSLSSESEPASPGGAD